MLKSIWPTGSFERRVAVLFLLITLSLGLAACVGAPLSFYGAFALFRVLDSRHFFASRGRAIDIALQVPVVTAMHFTDNLSVLRLIFCFSYAAVPLVGLAVSWLVCRSCRPNLFIWPALSICLIGLPGQFSFASEALMAVSLLWPAMLTVLVCPGGSALALVAITSIAAVCAHPNAVAMLGFAIAVAILSAVRRPGSRGAEIGFAAFLGVLLLIRISMPLDHYERHLLGIPALLMSFKDSVWGWPLVGIAFTLATAVSLLVLPRWQNYAAPLASLSVAGVAFVAWASHPAAWTKFDDYRFWEPAFSVLLMAIATVDVLRPRATASRSSEPRGTLLPVVGGIFLLVFCIMSFIWNRASNRLLDDLGSFDHGCISFKDVAAQVKDTALDQWSLSVYAVELQSRKPQTLLLKHNLSCRMFVHTGSAILADNPATIYIKYRGEGWFDFEDAQRRAREFWTAKHRGSEQMHEN